MTAPAAAFHARHSRFPMIVPHELPGPAEVARHYDDLDPWYLRLWGEHLHHGLWSRGNETPEEAVEALVEVVANRAGIDRDPGAGRPAGSSRCRRVVDVGCGYGASARLLEERFGCEVTGFTVSRAQWEQASRRSPSGRPAFRLGDWNVNTLGGESADAVISIECISHVADKARFLGEIHRVLRPGGQAAICAWLARDSPSRWEIRHLLEPICREGRLPGLASRVEIERLAAESGFADPRFEDLTDRVRRTWSICAARVTRRLVTDPELRAALRGPGPSREFARSVFRIPLAYRTGSMRYGLFSLVRR